MRFEDPSTPGNPDEGEAGDRVVVLLEPPDRKIAVIQAVRQCAEIGLKDAKELVERAPSPLLACVTDSEADVLYRKLIEAGARAAVEPADRYTEDQLAGVPRRFAARPPAMGCLGVGAGALALLTGILSVIRGLA